MFSQKKERINLISSITNQGKVRFMVYNQTMNSQTFIKFCQRLIKDADKKIYLILDNLRVHHSIIVKAWVEDHKDQIELCFLPSYSPELNPPARPAVAKMRRPGSEPPSTLSGWTRTMQIKVSEIERH
jgi:hypothetical protein